LSVIMRSPIRGIDPLTHGHDPAAGVGALDAREDDGRAAPGRILAAGRLSCVCRAAGRARDGLGIPALARVDIGVVEAAGADLDQHLAGPGSGLGQSVR
jgi:hypothetical protein